MGTSTSDENSSIAVPLPFIVITCPVQSDINFNDYDLFRFTKAEGQAFAIPCITKFSIKQDDICYIVGTFRSDLPYTHQFCTNISQVVCGLHFDKTKKKSLTLTCIWMIWMLMKWFLRMWTVHWCHLFCSLFSRLCLCLFSPLSIFKEALEMKNC